MTVLGAALRRHKIIFSVYPVHMGAFKISSARALPYAFSGSELFTRFNVYLALANSAFAVFIGAVADKIDLTVIVKQQRRVNSPLIDSHRLRPFAVYIIGIHIEILVGGIIGGDHIKSALIAADSGGKNSTRAVYLFEHHL